MTMKSFLRSASLGLVLSGLALSAQDAPKPFAVGVHMVSGLTALKDVTGNNAGAVVDFSYTGMLAKSNVPFRAGLAYNTFPGKTDDFQVKESLTAFQLFGDIVIKTGVEHLDLVTGLSVNKYHYKVDSPDASVLQGSTYGYGSQSGTVKGLKFGARFGVAYAFTSAWSAEVMLQITELGSSDRYRMDPSSPTRDIWDSKAKFFTGPRSAGINPSWLQVGAKYHF